MGYIAPVPKCVRDHLAQNTHPGLALDKYVESWDPNAASGKLSEHVQQPTVKRVVELSRSEPRGLAYNELHKRWEDHLGRLSATQFKCTTAGPLTLHLARASALENAGICLHPIYGFVYLPGSGLKGMARAYAETIWKPAQSNLADAETKILAVFGNKPGEPAPDRQHAGSVVFHDAWPTAWPKLIVDIVNNHHQKYYSAKPDDNEHAPGDWENPIPVYFLAVPAGVTFFFALAKRRADMPAGDELLGLGREWLVGALCHMGAGAKTAAGYGAFNPVDAETPVLPASARAAFETTLELVTPAFLAGTGQQAEDCDLRSATLRGLLRWWWRTMHAGFVDVKTLRAMEAVVWGDTDAGGAVRIALEPDPHTPPESIPCPFKKETMSKKGKPILVLDDAFEREHGIIRAPARTTQPLFYVSYGMDEFVKDEDENRRDRDAKKRKTRFCVWPGAKWTIRLVARPWKANPPKKDELPILSVQELPPDVLLRQAKAALWLLCHFGGVGSKARKGFGSFADIDAMALAGCIEVAAEFRSKCLVPEHAECDSESPAIGRALCLCDVETAWKDAWFALDQVGAAAQSFAQADTETGHGKHCEAKAALGLPRKIHGPLGFQLPHQTNWTPPKDLNGPKGDRHASPVHYHLAKGPDGKLIVRVVAFPSKYLPDPETSRKVLGELIEHLKSDLARRVKDNPQQSIVTGQRPSHPSGRSEPTRMPIEQAGSTSGARLEAVLLEEKTKNGGWKAKTADGRLSGPIRNSKDVPADKNSGDRVFLILTVAKGADSQFAWPTPEEEKRWAKKPGRDDRRPGARDRRGGRRSSPGGPSRNRR